MTRPATPAFLAARFPSLQTRVAGQLFVLSTTTRLMSYGHTHPPKPKDAAR